MFFVTGFVSLIFINWFANLLLKIKEPLSTRLKNTSIETVNIFNDHVLVQVDSALHQRTIAEVKNLSSYDVAARPWRKLIPTALHSD